MSIIDFEDVVNLRKARYTAIADKALRDHGFMRTSISFEAMPDFNTTWARTMDGYISMTHPDYLLCLCDDVFTEFMEFLAKAIAEGCGDMTLPENVADAISSESMYSLTCQTWKERHDGIFDEYYSAILSAHISDFLPPGVDPLTFTVCISPGTGEKDIIGITSRMARTVAVNSRLMNAELPVICFAMRVFARVLSFRFGEPHAPIGEVVRDIAAEHPAESEKYLDCISRLGLRFV